MKKKIISLLSALALTAQIVPCALADNDVKVYVNDTEMVTDAPIIIENDRTLVPVRAISEYLDYTVDWDNDTQTVVISKNITTLKFTIDNFEAIFEFRFYDGTANSKVSLEVAPQIINDTTYIPLSDFKSALSHVDLNVSIAARIDSNSDFKAAVSLSFFKFSPLLILAVTFSSFSFRYSDSGKPCGTRTERGQFATLDAILK